MTMPSFGVGRNDGAAYVPDMTHHPHVGLDGSVSVEFPDSPADDTVLKATATLVADTTYDFGDDYVEITDPFGRNVTVTSTDAGDITIYGEDYLGQRMTETITCIVGDADGKKAFKRILGYISASDLAGDVTLKYGPEYGLPFCATEIVRETVDGAAATEGAITAPDTNTPTATTGDVRGTFNPNTAGDAAKDITLTYIATSELSGGLYGQVQA